MASTMGRVDVFADRTAGDGSAIKMVTSATVEGLVTTPTAQRLTLRLRGDQFDGAPQAVVRVDNRQVASFAVPATRWTDYVVNVNWTAGPHTVAVGFVNDRYVRGVGDRNLRLDWVDFAGSGTVPAPLDDPYEARIVELVNAARTTAGLSRLTVSPCADRYAEDWSARMAATGVMAHRTDLGTLMQGVLGARSRGEHRLWQRRRRHDDGDVDELAGSPRQHPPPELHPHRRRRDRDRRRTGLWDPELPHPALTAITTLPRAWPDSTACRASPARSKGTTSLTWGSSLPVATS